MTPMMKCGHAANAVNGDKPVCVICFMTEGDKATQIADAPDLTGRKAFCSYGGAETQSSTELPFFEHRPDKDSDRYYCGCHGWD